MGWLRCIIGLLTAWVIAIGLSAAADATQDELIKPSAAGDLARVKALLASNTDLNARAPDGRTALIAASEQGRVEAVQALLAARADPNTRGADGTTALIQAAQEGWLPVAQALLAAGADVNAKRGDGVTALILASQNGHLGVAQFLISAKADVNAKTVEGRTALFAASYKGYLGIVRALVSAGADVNGQTVDGETALQTALGHGQGAVVSTLRDASIQTSECLRIGVARLVAIDEEHATAELDEKHLAGTLPVASSVLYFAPMNTKNIDMGSTFIDRNTLLCKNGQRVSLNLFKMAVGKDITYYARGCNSNKYISKIDDDPNVELAISLSYAVQGAEHKPISDTSCR
jgi:uncharacterized protein